MCCSSLDCRPVQFNCFDGLIADLKEFLGATPFIWLYLLLLGIITAVIGGMMDWAIIYCHRCTFFSRVLCVCVCVCVLQVRAVFAGHYHRNSYGTLGKMEMITTSAVGRPLGVDPSGFRVH